MTKQSKMSTISVRIEEELMKRVDTATNIMAISKSDFIRSCLEKLCDDNQLLIDHYDKIPRYIEYIRRELGKLPPKFATVKNGTIENVKEPTIMYLCDELWRSSKPVFDNWLALLKEYDLKRENTPDNFEQAKESDGLLGLDTMIMFMAEKSGKVSRLDAPRLLREPDWIENTEMDRVALSYACWKAFTEHTAQAIIEDYLNKERALKKGTAIRLVIDAKGGLRRSGNFLYLPIDTEEIPEMHKRVKSIDQQVG